MKINDYLSSDAAFDSLFPVRLQGLSGIHWTPLNVAAIAAPFLAPDADSRVIDVGAGIGKFCMAGSLYSKGDFTGIEQKKNLVTAGNKVIKQSGLQRANLIHANFINYNITAYTGVYCYNPFHENLAFPGDEGDGVERSGELYDLYTAHFMQQLNAMPIGTRLATYWLSISEVPGSYQLKETHCNDLLKLFIKEQ